MTWKRVGTALVFIPLFYLLVRYLPPLYFVLLVMAGALIGQYEFYRLYFRDRSLFQAIGLGMGLSLLIGFYTGGGNLGEVASLVFGISLFALLLAHLFFRRNLGETLPGISVILFGILYVTWTLAHLIPLRLAPEGIYWVFFVFLVTWAGDTGAYYVGRRLGRNKLAPVVSPSKTIEGTIGGVTACLLASLLAAEWFLPVFSMEEAAAVGLGIGFLGLLGDLSESMLKRSGGIKDSGSLIPGHGGVLDRVDSLIFTIPFFYYYVIYLRP
ncbi:MAG: phosphatidate cytidylyltransferase [Nitrospirae bacterium]|nr:phosphatidate cytidylyltransferase [Nitrospirota bacterium]